MTITKCTKCGRDLRVGTEQVGIDKDRLPVIHRFGYCDTCMCKYDLDIVKASVTPATIEKKNSTLSVIAAVFAFFTLTCFVGFIIGLIDLGINDKTKKHLGSWFAVIWFALCGFVFFAVGISDEEVKNVTPANVTIQTEEVIEENSNNIETTIFHVGEIAEYKDVQVSVISYEQSTGNDWAKPSSGNIFIFPEIEITNNSTEEIAISSLVSFECYCDDYKTNFSSNAFMVMSTDDEKGQLDGSIAPGKKMKGVLALEVPSNWSTIEIYYKDNVWLGSNFSFLIENN